MAVPTVTAIYPNAGPTGGRRLVQIMGSNFQLPPEPAALGPVPAPAQTVEVLFGGAAGDRVAVASSARLFVRTPVTPLDRNSPAGPVDVVVRNIDEDGELIPGEAVTVVNGYSYELPDLNALPVCDLVRLVRELLWQLKKQVLTNTSLDVHTDWSDLPTSGLAFISEVPAITLHGPDMRENRFYSTNAPRHEANTFGLGSEFSEELRPPYTVDLMFDLVGVCDRKLQNMALQAEIVNFFNRNKNISMARDPDDATLGDASWEMDFETDGQPVIVRSQTNSNIRAFKSRVVIRGFDIDESSMAVLITRTLEDQTIEGSADASPALDIDGPQQMGVTYLPGASPGE